MSTEPTEFHESKTAPMGTIKYPALWLFVLASFFTVTDKGVRHTLGDTSGAELTGEALGYFLIAGAFPFAGWLCWGRQK
jgi:hypothetical protein